MLLCTGTGFISGECLLNKLYAVYFNPKWDYKSKKHSYIGLEIADLFVYPIKAFCITKKHRKDFDIVESKLYGYPLYNGQGIKDVTYLD